MIYERIRDIRARARATSANELRPLSLFLSRLVSRVGSSPASQGPEPEPANEPAATPADFIDALVSNTRAA